MRLENIKKVLIIVEDDKGEAYQVLANADNKNICLQILAHAEGKLRLTTALKPIVFEYKDTKPKPFVPKKCKHNSVVFNGKCVDCGVNLEIENQ